MEVQDAWLHAQTTVGLATQPQVATVGGTGVLVAVLRGVGWAFPAPHAFITRDKTLIDMRLMCPMTVLQYLRDDHDIDVGICSGLSARLADHDGSRGYPRTVMEQEMAALARSGDATSQQAPAQPRGAGGPLEEDTAAHRAAAYSRLVYGAGPQRRQAITRQRRDRRYLLRDDDLPLPWFEPIARFAATRVHRHSPAFASALALAEGGWWSPWRKYIDGMTKKPRCACGKEAACLVHVLTECPHAKAVRDDYDDPNILEQARGQRWNPLFNAGVPMRPEMPPDPDPIIRDIGDHHHPRTVTGDVYTDGAMKGLCRRTLRAGWAFVMLDDQGVVIWGRYGTMAERYPTVLRSELRAALEATRHATGRVTVHTDNARVV